MGVILTPYDTWDDPPSRKFSLHTKGLLTTILPFFLNHPLIIKAFIFWGGVALGGGWGPALDSHDPKQECGAPGC